MKVDRGLLSSKFWQKSELLTPTKAKGTAGQFEAQQVNPKLSHCSRKCNAIPVLGDHIQHRALEIRHNDNHEPTSPNLEYENRKKHPRLYFARLLRLSAKKAAASDLIQKQSLIGPFLAIGLCICWGWTLFFYWFGLFGRSLGKKTHPKALCGDAVVFSGWLANPTPNKSRALLALFWPLASVVFEDWTPFLLLIRSFWPFFRERKTHHKALLGDVVAFSGWLTNPTPKKQHIFKSLE